MHLESNLRLFLGDVGAGYKYPTIHPRHDIVLRSSTQASTSASVIPTSTQHQELTPTFKYQHPK